MEPAARSPERKERRRPGDLRARRARLRASRCGLGWAGRDRRAGRAERSGRRRRRLQPARGLGSPGARSRRPRGVSPPGCCVPRPGGSAHVSRGSGLRDHRPPSTPRQPGKWRGAGAGGGPRRARRAATFPSNGCEDAFNPLRAGPPAPAGAGPPERGAPGSVWARASWRRAEAFDPPPRPPKVQGFLAASARGQCRGRIAASWAGGGRSALEEEVGAWGGAWGEGDCSGGWRRPSEGHAA